MITVMRGALCLGFVLERGRLGYGDPPPPSEALGLQRPERGYDGRDQCSGGRIVTDLVGLAIVMPAPCPRCNGTAATVGAGRGPHCASLMCVCGRHSVGCRGNRTTSSPLRSANSADPPNQFEFALRRR